MISLRWDRRRGRRALLAALLVPGAALVACGGDERDAAAEPVKVYFAGLAAGDGEQACEQISGEAQREMLGYLGDLLPEFGIRTCAEGIEALAGNMGADERAMLEDAAFEVELDGDRATVEPEGGTQAATVEKIDGRWLITGGLTGP